MDVREFLADVLESLEGIPEDMRAAVAEAAEEPQGRRVPAIRRALEPAPVDDPTAAEKSSDG
jgi:hypothetical protein